MTAEEKPIAPFLLSMIGGIFILLGAVAMSMFAFGTSMMMGMGDMMGMMTGSHGGMWMGMVMGLAPVLSLIGLASGASVIFSSVMLYNRPVDNQLWGALILAFSLVSIFGSMAGFVVGLVLGVVGGTMALAWKASPQQAGH